jgi:2-amino-4-hydroxy-6-hydroxymethyldihydropteridine diphosphokinase
MNKTYLLLGSNLGNSVLKIKQAKKHIEKKIGIIIRQSALYKTAPWGNANQPDFLNQVIVVETTISATELLKTNLWIEKKMGRVRGLKNAPRMIDIDILFFNKEIIRHKGLTVPHCQIQNRRFVLMPLNEIAAQFIHPVFNKKIHQLLLECADTLNVKKN